MPDVAGKHLKSISLWLGLRHNPTLLDLHQDQHMGDELHLRGGPGLVMSLSSLTLATYCTANPCLPAHHLPNVLRPEERLGLS